MSQKRVFIIHGWGGSPDEPLHRWLKSELEKSGFEVVVPKMPNSEEPDIKPWVLKLKEAVGTPDKDTILIGHSIGCQTILRYLEKLPPTSKVDSIVFIAPWLTLSNLEGDEEWQIVEPWLNTPIREVDVIKHVSKITSIFSDNDPYVPSENINLFKKRFNSEIVVERGKGHFTADDGVEKLESVLNFILDRKGEITMPNIKAQERTEEEYAERETLTSRIEGYTGRLESLRFDLMTTEDLKRLLEAIRYNWKSRKAQLKESQMEKEVPVKIIPVDEKSLEEGKVKPNEGLKDTQPLSNAEGTEEEEASALSEDAVANAERIETLRTDVEELKDSLKDYLKSGFKLELTEDQLKDLTSKVLSVVASEVTDITTERVEEIAGELLHVEEKK